LLGTSVERARRLPIVSANGGVVGSVSVAEDRRTRILGLPSLAPVSNCASTGVGGVMKVDGALRGFGGVAGDVITVGFWARFGDGVFSAGSSTNAFVNNLKGRGGAGEFLTSLLLFLPLAEKSLPKPLSPLRSLLVLGRSGSVPTCEIVAFRLTGSKASLSCPFGEGLPRDRGVLSVGAVVENVAACGRPGEVCGRVTVWVGIKGDELVRNPTCEG